MNTPDNEEKKNTSSCFAKRENLRGIAVGALRQRAESSGMRQTPNL